MASDFQFWTSLAVNAAIGSYGIYLQRRQLRVMAASDGGTVNVGRRVGLSFPSMAILILLMGTAWIPYFLGRSEDLSFAQWFVTPDGMSCAATVDASRLSPSRREKYEIALVCGFADPATDYFKDDRITVSPLFTPQDAIFLVTPMRKAMSEALEQAREEAIKKSGAQTGSQLTLANTIWFRIVLLPKGTDVSAIHRLADVSRHAGEIARASPAVGIVRTVTVK